MSLAPSAVAYRSESDTFIINYKQAARWHPTLARGKQWVVRGVLCCLAAQRAILITTHVSFESISITHWPFSPLYFIWEDGWWSWLTACMEPICGAAEIPSGDLTLSPSHRDWLMEGGTSLSQPAPSHPPPILLRSTPWGSRDNVYFGWLKTLPNNTFGSG